MLRRIFASIGLLVALLCGQAEAQSTCSYIQYGAVLTAAQWNQCFQAKNDALGFTPVNKAGDTMLGPLITVPSNTSLAGFNVPQGVAPTSPANGDIWMTTAGLFYRANGSTVGPLSAGGSNALDVWLLIGSSNTVGQGTSSQAPIPQQPALMYCVTGTVSPGPGVQPLTDPVCSAVSTAANWNANTGSMWPAFAIGYMRPVAIVQTAVSGSTQATACDFGVGNGNWQDTTGGSNYANSLTAINAALTAYAAAGWVPTFRGILQQELGVNDAARIDVSACTIGNYTAAFTAMAANYRSATIGGKVYPHLPIFMSLVPTNTNPAQPEIPGYAAVRGAQLAIAAADGNTLIAYSGAVSFAARGLMQTNSVHPVQAGYNEWGYNLAGAVLPFVPSVIPFQVFSANTTGQPLPQAGTVVQIIAKDGGGVPLTIHTWAASNGIGLLSANGTAIAPTQTLSGNLLGAYGMRGFGATGYIATNSGAFLCFATQNYTDTVGGSQCGIYVTPNGTIAPVQGIAAFNGNSVVIGPTDAAAPTAQTLSVQNVLTGTTNTAGAAFVIAGSRGTGNVAGGSIALQVAPAGSSGSTQNTLVTELTIAGTGNLGFGTETNPQRPFVFSVNATTGITLMNAAFTGPWMVGATSGVVGWNVLSVANLGNNNFFRIDGTIASPANLAITETIGTINFTGWGNGAFTGAVAQINAITLEAFSGTTFGTGIQFRTTAAGGAIAQSMYIKGGVIIGNNTNDPGPGNLGFINMLLSSTAPTISAGFCTSPSISQNNGTGAFEITVGSACAAGTGTLTMPAAAHNWKCEFVDVTTNASHTIVQTGGTTTTVTVQDYSRTTGAAQNMGSADVIRAHCAAY